MTVCNGKVLRAIVTSALGVLALGSLAACSTTQTVKVSKAAPITYKIGQGASQYASVTTPVMPRSTPPYSYTQSAPQTAPESLPKSAMRRSTAPTPQYDNFDPRRVDRTLYKHQKVGKRYTVMGKSYTPKHQPDYDVIGTASWYGDKFHGKPTATGETYNKNDITAAHKTLPLNSLLRVTNVETGKVLMVRLNDRGPFIGERIIDLSEAAARELGTLEDGLGKVRVQYAGPADPMAAKGKVTPPKPRYVAPQPQNEAGKEDLVVEAPRQTPAKPKPTPRSYVPLREQWGQNTPPQSAPMPYIPPVDTPQIQQVAPEYTQPDIVPEAYAPPAQMDPDTPVTLTIKGPIHMATEKKVMPKKTSSLAKPKFIPATYTSKTTQKTN